MKKCGVGVEKCVVVWVRGSVGEVQRSVGGSVGWRCGEVCWGVGGGVGKYWRRCGEVCWGVAGGVGKC